MSCCQSKCTSPQQPRQRGASDKDSPHPSLPLPLNFAPRSGFGQVVGRSKPNRGNKSHLRHQASQPPKLAPLFKCPWIPPSSLSARRRLLLLRCVAFLLAFHTHFFFLSGGGGRKRETNDTIRRHTRVRRGGTTSGRVRSNPQQLWQPSAQPGRGNHRTCPRMERRDIPTDRHTQKSTFKNQLPQSVKKVLFIYF